MPSRRLRRLNKPLAVAYYDLRVRTGSHVASSVMVLCAAAAREQNQSFSWTLLAEASQNCQKQLFKKMPLFENSVIGGLYK